MIIEILSIAVLAAADSSPVTTDRCVFGDVYQSQSVSCSFVVTNWSEHAVHVVAPASSGRDRLEPHDLTLAPHGSGTFTATLDTLSDSGEATHFFSFTTNDSEHGSFTTSARGFVNSILDDAKPKIDFGVFKLSASSSDQEIALLSQESPDLKITRIVESPDYLQVSVKNDGRELHASLKPNAPWGIQKDGIVVEFNSSQQKNARIEIDVDVHGAIVPSSNPFALGLIRQGNNNEALIPLKQQDQKDFKIGKVSLSGLKGAVNVAPCVPKQTGCSLLKLVLDKDQPFGLIKGQIFVEFPEYKQTLPIGVWGLYVAKDTQVRDLNKEMNEREANALSSATKPPIDLHSAITDAVNTRASAEPITLPSGKGPLLKWQISNQRSIHAYAIYRSDTENGKYFRVNQELIPVHDENVSVVDYAWRDNSAESGKTYWYYVGLVKKDGTKQQLSGPQKVVAK